MEAGVHRPTVVVQPLPGAVEEATAFVDGLQDTRHRFERVSDLIGGFESPYGLELLATVHWILNDETCAGDGLVEAVHRWSYRKRKFTPRQVRLAQEVLVEKAWIN